MLVDCVLDVSALDEFNEAEAYVDAMIQALEVWLYEQGEPIEIEGLLSPNSFTQWRGLSIGLHANSNLLEAPTPITRRKR